MSQAAGSQMAPLDTPAHPCSKSQGPLLFAAPFAGRMFPCSHRRILFTRFYAPSCRPSGLDLIDRAFVFVQLCAPSLRLRYLQSSTRRHSGERGLHKLHRLHRPHYREDL